MSNYNLAEHSAPPKAIDCSRCVAEWRPLNVWPTSVPTSCSTNCANSIRRRVLWPQRPLQTSQLRSERWFGYGSCARSCAKFSSELPRSGNGWMRCARKLRNWVRMRTIFFRQICFRPFTILADFMFISAFQILNGARYDFINVILFYYFWLCF